MRIKFLGAFAPAILLVGCNQAAQEPAAPAEADADAVLAAITEVEQGQAKAIGEHNVDGAAAVYAPDATFFDAGSPPVGGDAIRANFEAMLSDENTALEINRSGSWVAKSGELAVTMANYSFTTTGPDGKPVTTKGVNQTVWKKQDDGSWKIASDFNAGTGEE